MSGRIGLNVLGGGFSNETLARFIIDELRPRSVVVINEAKLAAMLVGSVERVLFRMKDTTGIKNDDSAYDKHDPVEFIDALNALAPHGCWLYAGNEFGSSSLIAQNNWNLAAVHHAHRLGRKVGIQAQYTHHFEQGAAGWATQRASIVEADALLPHIYYYPTVEAELALPRSGFSVLSDIRGLYPDKPLVISEFAYYHQRDARRGPNGVLDDDRTASDIEAAAGYCALFDADLCPFVVAQPGTEWETFNLINRTAVLRRFAAYNRSKPVGDTSGFGQKLTGGVMTLLGGATGVNFRSQPNGSAPLAGSSFKGREAVSYWSQSAGGWWKVERGGVVGYVSAQWAAPTGGTAESDDPLPPVPIPPVPEWDPTPEQRKLLAEYFRALGDLIEFGVTQTT